MSGYLSCSCLLAIVFAISVAVVVITNNPLLDTTAEAGYNNEIELAKLGIGSLAAKPPIVSALEDQLQD